MEARTRSVMHYGILLAAVLCTAGSAVAWAGFFVLYWPYRTLFDAHGRYFEQSSSVVYQEQAGLLAVPTAGLFVLALLFAALWRVRHNAKAPSPTT